MAPEQGPSKTKVKTQWIWWLRKDELVKINSEFLLDTTGSVDAMRKELYNFAINNSNDAIQHELSELCERYDRTPKAVPSPTPKLLTVQPEDEAPETSQKCREGSQYRPTAEVLNSPMRPTREIDIDAYPRSSMTPMELMDKVRKWGIKFDGVRDPLLFLERIEQLACAYGISCNVLPRVMPELLKDRAALWFCYADQNWLSWEEFKEEFLTYFLGARYKRRLTDKVRSREQGARESFKDYAQEMRHLIRHTGISSEEELELIYSNSRQEVQWYIKRTEFRSLAELVALADELELLEERSRTRAANRREPPQPAIAPRAAPRNHPIFDQPPIRPPRARDTYRLHTFLTRPPNQNTFIQTRPEAQRHIQWGKAHNPHHDGNL